MADEGFSREDFERLKKVMVEITELQDKINKGAGNYQEHIKNVQAAYRELKNLQQQISNAEKIAKDIRTEINKKLSEAKTLSEKKKFLTSKEGMELRKQLKIHQEIVKTLKKEEKTLSEITKELAQQVNSSNSLSSSFKMIGRGANFVLSTLISTGKEMLGQMKSVRQTELSMGILGKQAEAFRGNIYKTSLLTNQLGVDTSALAKMQGDYSEGIGRSVQLTEEGLVAMGELAKGTTLGAEGAAAMAVEMDKFGISVTGTRDLVEEMLDTAHKMGVNASKVTKTLQSSLKLAQRYHFKDGVKGLTRMAASAAAMKLDLEGISGMADKVFRPEGAVEMTSKLQVMGGEFAKLANPFELMFKARNDFEGFAKDIGKATKDFVQFNKETGQFDISGLQLDRMREIAQITGISVEKLQEMGVQAKKMETIDWGVNFSEDDKALITNMAEFNTGTGQWEINTGDFQGAVKDLKKGDLDRIKAEKKNLEERAKQAQTFDEKWQNIVNTFKATLLPFMEEIDKVLGPALQSFTDWAIKNQVPQKIAEFAKEAGKLAGGLIKWIADNPIKSGLIMLGGFLGKKLFDMAMWFAQGVVLGEGFMSVAGPGMMMGGMGGGGFGGGRGRGGRGGGGFFGMGGGGKGRGGRFGKFMGKTGRFMRGMGPGLIGMGLGMGLDYGRENWIEDPDSHAGKAMGIGSTALEYGGAGAMIGSIIPGIGTAIGGLIGGGIGALVGAYREYKEDVDKWVNDDVIGIGGKSQRGMDDFVMRPGEGAVPFNAGDTLIGMKDGGPIEKSFNNGNVSVGGAGGNINVTFGEIRINGVIEVKGEGGKSGELPLNDPIFARELSNLIQRELRKSIGGGKLSPNPKA